MTDANFDIAIVGGGPVGASCALALSGAGLHPALIEAQPAAAASADWDVRVYAISPQSRAFLQSLGAWDRMEAARLAPVRRMLIYGDGGARLEFSAYESGVAELACIVEAGALTRSLWSRLQEIGAALICPGTPRQLEIGATAATLDLEDRQRIAARLVVGADGAQSFVRQQAGLKSERHPYGQLGVVANFQCRHPHRDTAFQWFRKDGVLAWLPLPGERMSMVWSTPEAHAAELLSLSPQALCQRVAEAGAHTLGELDLITPAAAFPIVSLRVERSTAARVALIGDAAHVVHPLAGQGVNLGFADAAALAGVLGSLKAGRDPGEALLLRRFERARSEAVLAMRGTTDALARLFRAESPGAARLRNWGLNSADRLPVLKNLLTRHALG